MGRIGMENIPEEMDKLYHNEEKEFLVMTVGGTYGSKIGDKDYWDKSIGILGYVEVESGRTSSIKNSLDWSVKDYKSDDNFQQGDIIYRIKGRLPKLLDGEEPWINNEKRMSSLYVTEIISDNENNEFLENLLAEYKKEVSINSELLGKLILDKDVEQYETENDVEWCGDNIKIWLTADEGDVNELLAVGEEFYKNRQEWDRKIREYAAKRLTELANDWLTDEYYYDDDENEEPDEETESIHEITEKEFAERLVMCDLSFDGGGDFTVYYADDDMFWGHSVIVDGNIKTGFESASIAG